VTNSLNSIFDPEFDFFVVWGIRQYKWSKTVFLVWRWWVNWAAAHLLCVESRAHIQHQCANLTVLDPLRGAQIEWVVRLVRIEPIVLKFFQFLTPFPLGLLLFRFITVGCWWYLAGTCQIRMMLSLPVIRLDISIRGHYAGKATNKSIEERGWQLQVELETLWCLHRKVTHETPLYAYKWGLEK
jgi:hypothetical protein